MADWKEYISSKGNVVSVKSEKLARFKDDSNTNKITVAVISHEQAMVSLSPILDWVQISIHDITDPDPEKGNGMSSRISCKDAIAAARAILAHFGESAE